VLVTQRVAHTVSGVTTVWECDICGACGSSFTAAFDFVLDDLNIEVQVQRGAAVDGYFHIDDQGHASFVNARGCVEHAFLLEFEVGPRAVES